MKLERVVVGEILCGILKILGKPWLFTLNEMGSHWGLLTEKRKVDVLIQCLSNRVGQIYIT